MKTRIFYLLLALLGMGACKHEQDTPVEYGVPHADFRIKGRVCDPHGNPLPGIRIARTENDQAQDGTATDTGGNYHIRWEGWPEMSHVLRFTDPDGLANGGSFAEKVVTVDFSEEDRTEPGSGGWYDGTFGKTVDVTLEPEAE